VTHFIVARFLYTDTLKVLEKWGSCHFYGLHPDSNLAALEALLAKEVERCPAASPPISALFCECPSNPLLQSPDLVQLRKLADHYGFIIIMDETIGTFVNVNVLPYVDIIVTSLSKLFSGKADVMGGRCALIPLGSFSTHGRLCS
jgi:cystathionine gamma-synthase